MLTRVSNFRGQKESAPVWWIDDSLQDASRKSDVVVQPFRAGNGYETRLETHLRTVAEYLQMGLQQVSVKVCVGLPSGRIFRNESQILWLMTSSTDI